MTFISDIDIFEFHYNKQLTIIEIEHSFQFFINLFYK